jgi:predicted MPP superfamily phosphohydrolase
VLGNHDYYSGAAPWTAHFEGMGFRVLRNGHVTIARGAARTHAGQFFPWTFVIHWVHGPHAAGLSRRGRLWVYVSAGTGTWGPPVRLGTRPELTLLRLVAANRGRQQRRV